MTSRLHAVARLCLLISGGGALCVETPAAGGVAEGERPPPPGTDLFTAGVIPRLRIELEPGAVESLRKEPREFVAGKVSEGAEVYPQVAVHLKGSVGSSRAVDDKPSLTLDFCRFQNGRKFHGLRRIHLNNSIEDPSQLNEQLGSELFAAAGVPAPRVTHALVVLNGRALGLYVLKEGFTEDFLARHFKQCGGDLFEPEAGHDIDQRLKRNSAQGPTQGRAVLKALAAAVQEPDPALRWRRLEGVLDTERFVRFMAMEIMLGHRDGYCLARNNFRVYHDLDSGKMVFFPHGMDQLLGTPDLPWQPSLAGLVAKAVMDSPEGKQRYAATFATLFTNLFKPDAPSKRVDQLALALRPCLSGREWTDLRAEATRVQERIVQRQLALQEQLGHPPLKLMTFEAGIGHPEGWRIAEAPGSGKMEQAKGPEGVLALHIVADSDTMASWRTRSLLRPGLYRFEGRVRVAGVKPLSSRAPQGAALRVGGSGRPSERLTGDSSWRVLGTEFQVERAGDGVELICELRARAGEAWFALDSLKLLALKIYEN